MRDDVWTPAYNSDGAVREWAWVAELTGMLTLSGWPPGMRVIAREERPHPGAQLCLHVVSRGHCSPRPDRGGSGSDRGVHAGWY